MRDIRRRSVIVGAAATGAGLLLYLQSDLRHGRIMDTLLRRLGRTAGLRAPELTGEADAALVRQLWQLFTRMAARWQMRVDLDEAGLAEFLRAKTAEAPSYLTEYRAAGEILDEVEHEMRRDPMAFDQLFRMPTGLAAFESTRLGRLQKYVIGEFLELQMAHGGFRDFGYRNYRGYAGGPLSDPAHFPYRTR